MRISRCQSQSRIRTITTAVVAVYFLLFAGFLVPLHILSHAGDGGCGDTRIAETCCPVSGHDARTCQICLSDGHLATILIEASILTTSDGVIGVIVSDSLPVFGSDIETASARDPPV